MLMRIVFCLAFFGVLKAQEMGLIGDAIEAFSPCKNSVLTMERIIGLPPSKENYWDGSIDFTKYPGLPEARVSLKLNAPATITADEEKARILTADNTFHISFFKGDEGYNQGKFHVQGKPNNTFPNIVYLRLNGADICPNPEQWEASILGSTNKGTVDEDKIDNSRSSPCGRRIVEHQTLITHSIPTKEGDWPWHSSIFHQERINQLSYKCGGSLINSNTVLTAGHCVTENVQVVVPERIIVKLGQYHRLLSSKNTQEFGVYKVILHEAYGYADQQNDIALLKLSTEATFGTYVQPVCLWPRSEIDLSKVIDRRGDVIGWGYNENNDLSEYLSQASMPVVSFLTCLNSNREFFGGFLSDKNYCAGYRNGTSVCGGDSGGGMFFKKNNIYYIRGLVSLSFSTSPNLKCNPNDYVIFTDIAQYLDWIESNI